MSEEFFKVLSVQTSTDVGYVRWKKGASFNDGEVSSIIDWPDMDPHDAAERIMHDVRWSMIGFAKHVRAFDTFQEIMKCLGYAQIEIDKDGQKTIIFAQP